MESLSQTFSTLFKRGVRKVRLKNGVWICVYWGDLMGMWYGSYYTGDDNFMGRRDVPSSKDRKKVFRALRYAIAKETNPDVAATCERLFPDDDSGRLTLKKIIEAKKKIENATLYFGKNSPEVARAHIEAENLRRMRGGYENGNT